MTISNAGENLEEQELSFIAGGDSKWYSHFWRQFGNFLQNQAHFCHMTKQLHFSVENRHHYKISELALKILQFNQCLCHFYDRNTLPFMTQ